MVTGIMYPAKSIKLTALLSRTYKCNECSYETGKHIHLVEHVRLSHPENEIPVTLPIRSDPPQKPGFLFCRFCEFSCSEDRRRTMWEHLYYHTGEPLPFMVEEKSSLVYSYRGYSCSFCRYTQFNKIHIEDHIRLKHSFATICPSTLVKSHIFNMVSNVGDESSSSELTKEYESSESVKSQGLVIKQFYGSTDKSLSKKFTLARFDINSSKAKTINLKEKRKKLQELVDQRAKSKELGQEKKSQPKSNLSNNSTPGSQFNDNKKQILETNVLQNTLSKDIYTAAQSNIFLSLGKQLKNSDEHSSDSTKSPIPKITIGLKTLKCVSEIIKPISNFLASDNKINISLNYAEKQEVLPDSVISDEAIHERVEKGVISNGVAIDSKTNQVIFDSKSLTYDNIVLPKSSENTSIISSVNKVERISNNESLNKLNGAMINNQVDTKINSKNCVVSVGINSSIQLICKPNVKNENNDTTSCNLGENSKVIEGNPSSFEKPIEESISMEVDENLPRGNKVLTPELLTFTHETSSSSNTIDKVSNTKSNMSLIDEKMSLNIAKPINSIDSSHVHIGSELKAESDSSVYNIKSLTEESSSYDHILLTKNDFKSSEKQIKLLDNEEKISKIKKSHSAAGINSSESEFQNDVEKNISETRIEKQKIISEVVENFIKISEEIDQLPSIKYEFNSTPESYCKTKVVFETEQKVSEDKEKDNVDGVLLSNKDDRETSDANVLDDNKILTTDVLPNVPFNEKELSEVVPHKDVFNNTLITDVFSNVEVNVSFDDKETSVLPIDILPNKEISTTLSLTKILTNEDETFSVSVPSNNDETATNVALCSEINTSIILPEIANASTNNDISTLDEISTTITNNNTFILDVLPNDKEISTVDILPKNEKNSLEIFPNKEDNSTAFLCNNEKTSTTEALSINKNISAVYVLPNKKELSTGVLSKNDISTINHLPVNEETASNDASSINKEISIADAPLNNEAFNTSASNNEDIADILTKNKMIDVLSNNEKENSTYFKENERIISQKVENPEIKDINDTGQNLLKDCSFHPLIDSSLNLQSSNSSERDAHILKNTCKELLVNKIVVCQNCNYVCSDWHAIVEHFAVHNSTFKIQLQFLDKIPKSQEDFPIFIQNPNICGCGSCFKSTSTIELLHDHIHNCHQEATEFVCKHCNKVYHNDKEFCSHLNFHGPELYKCRLCSFIHWQADDVVRHMLLHHQSNEKLILIRKSNSSKTELTNNSSEIAKQQINVDNLSKPMEKSAENLSNYTNEALIARALLKMTKASISNEKEIVFNCIMCGFSSQVQYLLLRHCEKEHLNSMKNVNAINATEGSDSENTLSTVNYFHSQNMVENNLNQNNKEILDFSKIPKAWNLLKENIVKDLKCQKGKGKLEKKLNSEVKNSQKKLKHDYDDESKKVTSLLHVKSKDQVKKLPCKRTNNDTLSSLEDLNIKRFKNISIEERVKIKRLKCDGVKIKSDDSKLHKDRGLGLTVWNSNKIENDAGMNTKRNKSLKTGCNDGFKDISVFLELQDKAVFSVPYKELKKYINLCPRVLLER